MILYGASGHAKVIIDILHAMNDEVSELFDDNDSIETLQDIKVSKPRETVEKIIISIGNGVSPKDLINTYTFETTIVWFSTNFEF